MKNFKGIILIGLVIVFSFMVGCNKTSTSSTTSTKNLSYKAYQQLIKDFQSQKFDNGGLSFEKSTLNNPIIVMVNKEMSFGKKQRFLSLNDEQKDSVQEIISFREKNNKYKLVTTWIFTKSTVGNNLLMLKPPEVEKPVYDNIISYNNLLIHVQLIPLKNSNQNLAVENAKVITALNQFLTSYKP